MLLYDLCAINPGVLYSGAANLREIQRHSGIEPLVELYNCNGTINISFISGRLSCSMCVIVCAGLGECSYRCSSFSLTCTLVSALSFWEAGGQHINMKCCWKSQAHFQKIEAEHFAPANKFRISSNVDYYYFFIV